MSNSDEYLKAEFVDEYSESKFWSKVTKYAKKAGAEVIEKAICLWYVLQKSDTPAWAKATIIGALGYFISPIDAIPDMTPMVGYVDDLGVLMLAIATVSAYIDDEVREKARNQIKRWFG